MFNVTIDTKDIKNLSNETIEKISKGVLRMGNDVYNDLKRETPAGVSHYLQKSISLIPLNLTDYTKTLAVGVGAPGVKYALPFYFGSKPHFPPVGALIDWVILRGFGDVTSTPLRRAFQLAYIISKRGTKSHTHILEKIINKYKNKGGYFNI